MINLHERMLPTSAGVEPATSWSPVGQRIQLSHRAYMVEGTWEIWWQVIEQFVLSYQIDSMYSDRLVLANSVDPDQMPQNALFATNPGPAVQSVVSLTSSLRVISLADSIYNILKFFAEKMWVAFALQKLLTFFQQKISAYLHITQCKF